jgi:hypothetical protein
MNTNPSSVTLLISWKHVLNLYPPPFLFETDPPLFLVYQKFMGKSENGMNSLETRVHGLEMALDEISRDLAFSSGRMSNKEPSVNTCCILSPKFWRRHDGGTHSSRFSVSDAANSSEVSRTSYKWERQKFQGGFVTTNPLAEPNIPSVRKKMVTHEGRKKDAALQK